MVQDIFFWCLLLMVKPNRSSFSDTSSPEDPNLFPLTHFLVPVYNCPTFEYYRAVQFCLLHIKAFHTTLRRHLCPQVVTGIGGYFFIWWHTFAPFELSIQGGVGRLFFRKMRIEFLLQGWFIRWLHSNAQYKKSTAAENSARRPAHRPHTATPPTGDIVSWPQETEW